MYQDLAKEFSSEHENDGYTNCNWCSWYNYQTIGKRTREIENKRTSEDHSN